LVLSAVAQEAFKTGSQSLTDDLWNPEDLQIVCRNLLEACKITAHWETWPLDRSNFKERWIDQWLF
ncbi:MAG: hypothetical protein DCC75_11940, partial [Proteobacteria bacterium]